MELKISKSEVALDFIPNIGEYVSIAGVLLKFAKATKTHLIFSNVSISDIELLRRSGVSGLLVKSRHVRGYVSAESSEWLG